MEKEKLYLTGLLPIENMLKRGRLRNVYIIAEYLNDQGAFEGVVVIKDSAKDSHIGLVRGHEKDGKYSFLYMSPTPVNTKSTGLSKDALEGMNLQENEDVYDNVMYFEDITLKEPEESVQLGNDFMARIAPFASRLRLQKTIDQATLSGETYSTTKLCKVDTEEELMKINDNLMIKVDGYFKFLGAYRRKNPFKSIKLKDMPRVEGDLAELLTAVKEPLPEIFKTVYDEYGEYEATVLGKQAGFNS